MSRLLSLALLVLLIVAGGGAAGAALPDAEPRHVTAHFRFYGPGDVGPSVNRVAADAEARWARLCAELSACDIVDDEKIDVWVAEDHVRFAQAFPDGSPMAEWAAGVAFLDARRIVLRAHGTALFSLIETFEHEISHLLVHAATGGRGVPRWLSEGLAIWQSGEGVIDRLATAHRAALTGSLIPFDQLTTRFPREGSRVAVAYAQSALFTRGLVERHGSWAVCGLLSDVASGADFDAAFVSRFGAPPDALGAEWIGQLESTTSPVMLFRDGTLFWVLMSVLFVLVAFKQIRARKAAIEEMGEQEDAERIFAELEARRQSEEPPTLH